MFDSLRRGRQQRQAAKARAVYESMRQDLGSPRKAQLPSKFSSDTWHAIVSEESQRTKDLVLSLAAKYHGQAAGITLAARSLEDVLGGGAFETDHYHQILNGAFALDLTQALLASNLPSPLVSSILTHLEQRFFGHAPHSTVTAQPAPPAEARLSTADLSRRIAEVVYTSFDRYERRQARRQRKADVPADTQHRK